METKNDMSEIINIDRAQNTPAMLRPVAKPAEIIEVHKEAVQLIQQALEEGRDYGVIPGTGTKPTLLKAGAERLLGAFDLYADSTIVEQDVEHDHVNVWMAKKWVAAKALPSKPEQESLKAQGLGRFKKTADGWQWQEAVSESGESLGLYRFVVQTQLRMRSTDRIVGVGLGSCSSLESKYIRSPRDFENTVLKMAKKRSLIDATLSTLALSDRFTQDVEDMREALVTEPEHVRDEAQNGQPVSASSAQKSSPAFDPESASDVRSKLGLSGENDAELKPLAASRGLKYSEAIVRGWATGQRTYEELVAWLANLPEVAVGENPSASTALEEPATATPTTDTTDESPFEESHAEKVLKAMSAKERLGFKAAVGREVDPIQVIEAFLATGEDPFYADLLAFAKGQGVPA